MNYEESIAYIHGKSGMGKKVGLQNMEKLLARLGNPHKGLCCLHVAGTNGKGSTCAYLASVLRQTGAKVGLYTSPYLMRYNERIELNGVPIPDDTLAALATEVKAQADEMERTGEGFPTVFELGTAIMFLYFARESVDFAVIEVGMGGRFDPTNVLSPTVCAIARIGLDHTKVLGDTVEKIAFEKAGIIKENVPVVLQKQGESIGEVVAGVAAQKHAKLLNLDGISVEIVKESAKGTVFACDLPHFGHQVYEINLCGAYQVDNALTALGALALLPEEIRPSVEEVKAGLAEAAWPGRLEWFGNLLLDGAHNPQGAQTVREYAEKHLSSKKIILLTGMMHDKDVSGVTGLLAPLASEIFTVQPEHFPRALTARQLAEIYEKQTFVPIHPFEETNDALKAAKTAAGQDGIVLICGSLYLVGEVRLILTEGA